MAALSVVFVGVVLAIGYVNQPPTVAQQRATAERGTLGACRGWAATRTLRADMQDDVCRCVATRGASPFGGVTDADLADCRQRVAARMTGNRDLDTAFTANFPALCGALEGRISGLAGDGSSPFCQCFASVSGQAPAIKALYAFGGGEPVSKDRDGRLRQCTETLAYGEGWKSVGQGQATMHLPPFLPYRDLVLRCDGANARFEVLSGGQPIPEALAFFDDDGTNFGLLSGQGVVVASTAYGLIEKLLSRNQFTLQAGTSAWLITLSGFTAAAANVLGQCPEPVAAAPIVAAVSRDYPDPWEEPDAGYALIYDTGSMNWFGSLVCDADASYLSLQGPLVAKVIARNPDPAKEHLAANVRLSLAGDGGSLVEDTVWCDWGANEGDTDSCFVLLDKARLDKLYGSGFLAVTLDGETLDPVAFATSKAVSSARKTCYRNLHPLP